MCGIAATLSDKKSSVSEVVDLLEWLEFRGYDSWGIAATSKGEPFNVIKRVGSISDPDNLRIDIPNSNIIVGHTRWTTHGAAKEVNSHPHFDSTENIAVVHNGCVLNFQELKSNLAALGHKFKSGTDTEVIPHMIEEKMKVVGTEFAEAVRLTAKELQGESSFIAVNAQLEQLVAVRNGNPLSVGVCDDTGKFFISSDPRAFIKYTNSTLPLSEKEVAVFDMKNFSKSPRFMELESGRDLHKEIVKLDMIAEVNGGKGEYEHYMIKEIMQQSVTMANAVDQEKSKIEEIGKRIAVSDVFLIGCGTTGRVCAAGEYLFSSIASKPTKALVASEFRYVPNIGPNSLVIAVSQSGTTADTLQAINIAKSKGAKVLSLLNVPGSAMSLVSDYTLMINAGTEQAVASTKATTAQLSLMSLLAYASVGKMEEGREAVLKLASAATEILNPEYDESVKSLAKLLEDNKRKHGSKDNILIVGRGLSYPIAQEAAIKLQETCYMDAIPFSGGELKHGPLALVTHGTSCIVFAPNDESKDDMLNNTMEIKSRHGSIIGISPTRNVEFDHWLRTPDVGKLSPIISIIPVQMLAYRTSLLRGINPDRPRNLAKSVTVT